MTQDGRVDPDDISFAAQDYLKVIWSATEWGEAPITTKALAARFGTSAANVTETVKRLAGQGLVEYRPYKPVTLTPSGTRYALAMVRRHRLLETFLVTTLGYGWDEVHDEAERLEHAVSDTLVERIDAQLGHPRADPHGDPIPDASGRTAIPADAVLLSTVVPGEIPASTRSGRVVNLPAAAHDGTDVEDSAAASAGGSASEGGAQRESGFTGDYVVVRVSDADPALLAEAAARGLVPGAALVAGGGPAAKSGPMTRIDEVPAAIRAIIWVRPA